MRVAVVISVIVWIVGSSIQLQVQPLIGSSWAVALKKLLHTFVLLLLVGTLDVHMQSTSELEIAILE